MNIWAAREKSFHWLSSELYPQATLLEQGFNHLAELVAVYEALGEMEGESEVGQFARVVGITLAKFSHLLLGCYSLTLDGLAQEAGALLRPLIESYELLVYFRQDTNRVAQAIENKLPSAGVIGKRISGKFYSLRKYLNENAAHFSYNSHSLAHLLRKGKIQIVPDHTLEVLRRNLQVLNVFQAFELIEGVNCLFAIGIEANEWADKIESWRDECIAAFR